MFRRKVHHSGDLRVLENLNKKCDWDKQNLRIFRQTIHHSRDLRILANPKTKLLLGRLEFTYLSSKTSSLTGPEPFGKPKNKMPLRRVEFTYVSSESASPGGLACFGKSEKQNAITTSRIYVYYVVENFHHSRDLCPKIHSHCEVTSRESINSILRKRQTDESSVQNALSKTSRS